MARVRDILDVLGRETLVRLTHERDLGPRASNEERRRSLAKSFRGDFSALLSSLRRSELVEVFHKLTFVVGDTELYLSGPTRYLKADLVDLGLDAFVRGVARSEFRPVPGAYQDDGELDEHDDDEPNVGDVFPRLTGDWSRPRMMARIMGRLGFETPKRLRTTRFREVIACLSVLGIEAAYVDGSPVGPNDRSPGIDAKLRLRLEAGPKEAAVESSPRGVSESPSVPSVGPTTDRPATRGPAIRLERGVASVDVAPSLSPYQLALLRLQLLTAVPCFDRKHQPTWPFGFLEAAVRDLSVSAHEASLLERIAAGLCTGTHSPLDVVQRLVHHLDFDTWKQLLADLRGLNPSHIEVVEHIVEHVNGLVGTRKESAPDALGEPPRDLIDDEPTQRSIESKAATARHRVEEPDTMNHRDLGPLDDMFD